MASLTQRQKLIQFLKGMALSGEVIENIADYVNENYRVKAKPSDYTFFDDLIKRFAKMYSNSRSIEYFINWGIERRAIGVLINLYKSSPENTLKSSEETILDFEKTFKICLSITDDKYMYANMSLTYISLNINKIKITLNGTKTNLRADKNRRVAESIQKQFATNNAE
jgi:hypothetical protein